MTAEFEKSREFPRENFFTRRETEILQYLAEGFEVGEIPGKKLTIRTQVSSIRRKMRGKNLKGGILGAITLGVYKDWLNRENLPNEINGKLSLLEKHLYNMTIKGDNNLDIMYKLPIGSVGIEEGRKNILSKIGAKNWNMAAAVVTNLKLKGVEL